MKGIKNKKGFTLVEMVVVLVIIAILATLGIGALTGYVDRAQKTKCHATCREVLLSYVTVYAEDLAQGTATRENFKSEVERALILSGHPKATIDGNDSPLKISGLCGGNIITVTREEGTITVTCSVHDEEADASGAKNQARNFIEYMTNWLEEAGGAFVGDTSTKGNLFAAYYADHPNDIVQMSEEYQQKLVAAGLNSTLKNSKMYWWTYPVTDSKGNLLYTVTYANKDNNADNWKGNVGSMRGGFVVIVNGKTYIRSNVGSTVQPGHVDNPYKTPDALEEKLKENGYIEFSE